MRTRCLEAAVRDVYRRIPEFYHLQPWEMQHVLFSLGYIDELAREDEIGAAIEVARQSHPRGWRLRLGRAA
jgi:hypothetical protein